MNIELAFVEVACRKKRPKIQEIDIQWPVIPMRGWCKYIFENAAFLLLGGHRLGNAAMWQAMFESFWERYKTIRPHHELFSSNKPLGRCIPYMVHGDEGVSHRRVPFLVESWQPVISHLGMSKTSVSGILAIQSNTFLFRHKGGVCLLDLG